MTPSASWNYRIISGPLGDGEGFELREVHYNEAGVPLFDREPKLTGAKPVALKWHLAKLEEAFNQPALRWDDLKPVQRP